MAEYVTKEKVLAQLERCARDPYHESHYIRDAAVNTIRRMEAADVAPVRHGRWEVRKIIEPQFVQNGYTLMYCSECGRNLKDAEHFDYCPYCGARMDGENDD